MRVVDTEILLLHRQFSVPVAEEAPDRAMELGNLEVGIVHQLASSTGGISLTAAVGVPAELGAVTVSAPDPSEYDALRGGMAAW